MAIDNECENISSMLEEHVEVAYLIIEYGHCYYQHQARWQVADLIVKTNMLRGAEFLKQMIMNDEDKYVQRRALLSLYELSQEEAKRYALRKIMDSDEYLRDVSKKILESH